MRVTGWEAGVEGWTHGCMRVYAVVRYYSDRRMNIYTTVTVLMVRNEN